MNRDARSSPDRRPYRLWVPTGIPPASAVETLTERAGTEVAPWVIAAVRAWPRTVEDRLVAVRMGLQLHHVQLARKERPTA